MENNKDWKKIWQKIGESETQNDILQDKEYDKCVGSREDYINGCIEFYDRFRKRWSGRKKHDPKLRYLLTSQLMVNIYKKESNNNEIADLLSEILVNNVSILENESKTRSSVFFDLCCDVFMAADKEKAIERIAILYDMLGDAASDPEYKDYYTEKDMSYVKDYVAKKWFNPNWLSNNLSDNVQYMKDAAESEKEYVRTFAELFTNTIKNQEAKLSSQKKQGKQKVVARRDIIVFLLGMISGILIWGCISMVIDKFNAGETLNPSQAIESQVEEDESTKDKQDQENDTASDDKQQPTVTSGPEDSFESSGRVTKDDKDTDPNATTDISAGQDLSKNPDEQTGSEAEQGADATGNNSNNNNGIITNDTQKEETVQLTSERTIRKVASAAGEEMGQLEMGTTVTVLEQGVQQIIDEVSGYWCKITYAGASADAECYMWIKQSELAIGR